MLLTYSPPLFLLTPLWFRYQSHFRENAGRCDVGSLCVAYHPLCLSFCSLASDATNFLARIFVFLFSDFYILQNYLTKNLLLITFPPTSLSVCTFVYFLSFWFRNLLVIMFIVSPPSSLSAPICFVVLFILQLCLMKQPYHERKATRVPGRNSSPYTLCWFLGNFALYRQQTLHIPE
jgi:hypothetical protein